MSRWVMATVVAICVLIISCAFYMIAQDIKRWEVFKIEHKCKLVREISGSSGTGIGVGSDGSTHVTFVSTDSKRCWLCDDGVEYCR